MVEFSDDIDKKARPHTSGKLKQIYEPLIKDWYEKYGIGGHLDYFVSDNECEEERIHKYNIWRELVFKYNPMFKDMTKEELEQLRKPI